MNLFSHSEITRVLRERGLRLSSRLGQHFMINPDTAGRMLDYAGLGPGDTVLEVGPGLGTLTLLMAPRVAEVVAVEVDAGFAAYLTQRLDEEGVTNVRVVRGDILRLPLGEVAGGGEPGEDAAGGRAPGGHPPGKSVSNFPYSAGIRSLIRILEELPSVRLIVGTVQRELAERVAAAPGRPEYAFVSVYLQLCARVRVLERVPPTHFFPSPRVESAVVSLESRRDRLDPAFTARFKRVARAAFAGRRKSLVNNLVSLGTGLAKQELSELVGDLFGEPGIRAERLSVEDFSRLTGALEPHLEEPR
jgi:16S rRNA (adenine1518-N6/adenine1519-N6)-dimethyltransferase